MTCQGLWNTRFCLDRRLAISGAMDAECPVNVQDVRSGVTKSAPLGGGGWGGHPWDLKTLYFQGFEQ